MMMMMMMMMMKFNSQGVVACVEDRPETPRLRDMDLPSRRLLHGESISLTPEGVSGRNTKLLLKVKDQGQRSSKPIL